jgi:integrase
MSQAKTLTQDEYEKLFAFVENRKYALRNKMILLTGFKTGHYAPLSWQLFDWGSYSMQTSE